MHFSVHTLSDQRRGFKGNNPKFLKSLQRFILKLYILSVGSFGFHIAQEISPNKLADKELKIHCTCTK